MDRENELSVVEKGVKASSWLAIANTVLVLLAIIIFIFASATAASKNTAIAQSSVIVAVLIIGIYAAITVYYFMKSSQLKKSFPNDLDGLEKNLNSLFIVTLIIAILNATNLLGLLIYGLGAYYLYKAKESAINIKSDSDNS